MQRKKTVGVVNLLKKNPLVESIEDIETLSSEILPELVKLSRDIDVLKEKITICNEVFKKERYEAIVKSDLPNNDFIDNKFELRNSRRQR